MAIKVLSNARDAANQKYKAICESCGSELSWLQSDAKVVAQATERARAYTKIDCAVCGAEVTGFWGGDYAPAAAS